MKLKFLKLENFRAYKDQKKIFFDDLTTIIGKNDIGKSSILEALDIFFENRKIDANDRCIYAGEKDYCVISVGFENLPEKIVLDSSIETTLQSEYLLNAEGILEIRKTFQSKIKTEIVCQHPKSEKVSDLLQLKIDSLKERAKELGVPKENYNAKISSDIRRAIREFCQDELETNGTTINIDQEGLKNIWEKINQCLPLFALFQADRKNDEKDSEIQDPLKFAAEQSLRKYIGVLNRIKERVEKQVSEIADLTIEKLKEMNEDIATKLKPQFGKELKWADLFKPTITSDGIPMNKRGSGVRRLLLINFFRAEAERKRTEKNSPDIIYAIEEPETSQHPDWQIKLMKALIELSKNGNTQVIVSTHSPALARLAEVQCIRFVWKDEQGNLVIENGDDNNSEKIAETLGILPNPLKAIEKIKVILCVEGPNDIVFLNNLLRLYDYDIANDERIITISLGGATLEQWVKNNYLRKLGFPEIHIYDSDVVKYKTSVDSVNARGGKNYATQTLMNEIENYLHPEIIKEIFSIDEDFIDMNDENWLHDWKKKDVPKELSAFLKKLKADGNSKIRGESVEAIKPLFAHKGSCKLTKKHIQELEAEDEIKNWISKIDGCLN